MRRVIIESPWRSPIARPHCSKIHRHHPGPCPECELAAWCDDQVQINRDYLAASLRESLRRGEAPFASHALYAGTGALDDDEPSDRELGIQAGLWWGECAEATVVMTDLGITEGMQRGVRDAYTQLRTVEQRQLGGTFAEHLGRRRRDLDLIRKGIRS